MNLIRVLDKIDIPASNENAFEARIDFTNPGTFKPDSYSVDFPSGCNDPDVFRMRIIHCWKNFCKRNGCDYMSVSVNNIAILYYAVPVPEPEFLPKHADCGSRRLPDIEIPTEPGSEYEPYC